MTEREAVLRWDGEWAHPSVHATGPWDDAAQHGGVPAALSVAVAEAAAEGWEGDWSLRRLSLELPKPVPMQPLRVTQAISGGRSVKRVRVTLHDAAGSEVASALLLMQRRADSGMPAFGQVPAAPPVPSAEACTTRVRFGGMPDRPAFHTTGMHIRLADGDSEQPGPATAWFRAERPLVSGRAPSATMLACAASDFGNGLSWETPFADTIFVNSDLTVFLERPPEGDWLGVAARTRVARDGSGMAQSQLFDHRGHCGEAFQNLLVFARPKR
ncbi:acyl-CoA thioesterase domain-containing protein [Algiphilus sp.]|uniref:acyl-CoA thioesterase domain-containing protein n=1 Tax=Algiphilus sp. TaxID=1872431 RepID=UPI003B523181